MITVEKNESFQSLTVYHIALGLVTESDCCSLVAVDKLSLACETQASCYC